MKYNIYTDDNVLNWIGKYSYGSVFFRGIRIKLFETCGTILINYNNFKKCNCNSKFNIELNNDLNNKILFWNDCCDIALSNFEQIINLSTYTRLCIGEYISAETFIENYIKHSINDFIDVNISDNKIIYKFKNIINNEYELKELLTPEIYNNYKLITIDIVKFNNGINDNICEYDEYNIIFKSFIEETHTFFRKVVELMNINNKIIIDLEEIIIIDKNNYDNFINELKEVKTLCNKNNIEILWH